MKEVKKNIILSVREKQSFTQKWQNEPLSIGLFFYKQGSEMLKSLEMVIKKKITVNNEYFPSLSYNFLKQKKLKIVKNFCHIGRPYYLEIFKKWKKFNIINKTFKKEIKKFNLADVIIIPAAGLAKRFLKENVYTPKFLCRAGLEKKVMINLIKDYLPKNKKIKLITLKRKPNLLIKNFKIHYKTY